MITGALVILAIIAAAFFAWRPARARRDREGRVMAFAALLVLPVLAGFAGLSSHLEASKQTSYCVSCHAMGPYENSLHIDDVSHLAATHFQNARVPRETACYACHTNYTFYGDLKDKIRGTRHLLVQYIGHVPNHIKLYEPYNNRECLHCHGDARAFNEAATHKAEAGRIDLIRNNKLSCVTVGCHNVVHEVGASGANITARREP
jgi:nitrate/TMAO reductase-like tetraheme cytochrome c subunit